jgi:hypothetical protein
MKTYFVKATCESQHGPLFFSLKAFQGINFRPQTLPRIKFKDAHAACLVVSSPTATEETGAVGREVESRQEIGWWLKNKILNFKKYKIW